MTNESWTLETISSLPSRTIQRHEGITARVRLDLLGQQLSEAGVAQQPLKHD